METKMNSKNIIFNAFTLCITLMITTPLCFAKTLPSKPLTKEQIEGLANDSYMRPAPTQQWTFVNQTNQPMQVNLTTSSKQRVSKWQPGPFESIEIKTPKIEPNKTYIVEYEHSTPLLSEIIFTFLNPEKGNLSTFTFTSRMDINDINTAPKGIITVRDNGLSEPYIEIQ